MGNKKKDRGDLGIKGIACTATGLLHLGLLIGVLRATQHSPPPLPEPQVRVRLSLLPPTAPPSVAADEPSPEQDLRPQVSRPRNTVARAAAHAPVTLPVREQALRLLTAGEPAADTPAHAAKGQEHSVPLAASALAPSLPPSPVLAGMRDPSWEGEVLAHLEKFRRYPNAAMARRQEGVAYVVARVDHRGDVVSARLRDGSGVASLDRAALATFERAEPLPRPPRGLPDPVEIDVPVEFFLRQ